MEESGSNCQPLFHRLLCKGGLADVTTIDESYALDAIYARESGPVFLTGIQALVRLPLDQRRLDRALGLRTAGLVSGYRGSPLGAYDQQLWKAKPFLEAHDVVFQPGLNEDLAATALWGAQMHSAFGPTRVDGVFGLWFGKGPGVDRTGDVFRSANMLGTSALGGVLAISGDDHAAQSSMYPHQTDGIFQAASIPVLQPASVAEILELGLAGIALSRYSGLWVGMKTIAEVVETAAAVWLRPPRPFVVPDGGTGVPHSLNWDPTVPWPSHRSELERRLLEDRLPAARSWARANRLDRAVVLAPARRLGIVTVGKAHRDLLQAIADLGLSTAELQAAGISVYKVAMSWPLDTASALEFAQGHEELLVVEEKRSSVESQLKDALYHLPAGARPRVTGKTDEAGRKLLPEAFEFNAALLARVLATRAGTQLPSMPQRLAALEARTAPRAGVALPARRPYFCSGCPHNTSTRTPDGSISGGGIGCHVMALMDPTLKTGTFCQMGGEGAQWMGAQPFSRTQHIFQNLGDGTYQHSGLLAIRAALAAGTSITYKILYNDAVAMTGGQPAEGINDPARITRQLHAEGVDTIALVAEDPARWRGHAGLAPGTTVHHRDELDAVQRRLREIAGVTAIVYDQTCAAEKRRRRKRSPSPAAERRLYIHPRVCEGCGDCAVQSNCIAIEPLSTPYGRKRTINQTACNTDLSCVKGFCPSFVELEGAQLVKPSAQRLRWIEAQALADLPLPAAAPLGEEPFNVCLAGIGGTGVLTAGALLGMAATLEGRAASVLDFTGFAQKNGAVVSQVRLALRDDAIQAPRIGAGQLDLLVGADLVVGAGDEIAARLCATRTAAVVNLDLTPTAEGIRQRDAVLPRERMLDRIGDGTRPGGLHTLEAGSLALALFGDTAPAHLLLLGFAWQLGLLPLSMAAINRAIELNGVAVQANLRAFQWGRAAAARPQAVQDLLAGQPPRDSTEDAGTLEALVRDRAQELRAYQDEAYAQRYRELVARAGAAEAGAGAVDDRFARAVAQHAFQLMAYKDEYEVARLYADAAFDAGLRRQFSHWQRLSVWLAPPLLARIDPATGRPRKRRFGAWVLPLLRILAAGKRLRGTRLDPFGRSEERQAERRLVADYFATIERLCERLPRIDASIALQLARLPGEVRGFGPVKQAAIRAYDARRAALLADLEKAQPQRRVVPIEVAA
jgi:indolepyruvate ferredoxin oxidoreductase